MYRHPTALHGASPRYSPLCSPLDPCAPPLHAPTRLPEPSLGPASSPSADLVCHALAMPAGPCGAPWSCIWPRILPRSTPWRSDPVMLTCIISQALMGFSCISPYMLSDALGYVRAPRPLSCQPSHASPLMPALKETSCAVPCYLTSSGVGYYRVQVQPLSSIFPAYPVVAYFLHTP